MYQKYIQRLCNFITPAKAPRFKILCAEKLFFYFFFFTFVMISFYISGFGCFGNFMDINPTDFIVQYLKENLDEINKNANNFKIKFLIVSQVGAIDSLQSLLSIQNEYIKGNQQNSKEISVFLHLGVSGIANQFTLEKKCYNEAIWDKPDSKGWICTKDEVNNKS